MHLDEVARRSNHQDRDLCSSVLQRFLCNKQHPKIGFLVTSLLSTAAEAKLFDKEQKFLKVYGNNNEENAKLSSEAKTDENNETKPYDQFSAMMHYMQHFMQAPRMPQPFPNMRFPSNFRRGGFNSVRPRLGPNYTGCHKCGDFTHLKVDCPRK